MTARQMASLVLEVLRLGVALVLLVLLAAVALRAVGVVLPVRGLGHVELAYLAGAWWLLKGGGGGIAVAAPGTTTPAIRRACEGVGRRPFPMEFCARALPPL